MWCPRRLRCLSWRNDRRRLVSLITSHGGIAAILFGCTNLPSYVDIWCHEKLFNKNITIYCMRCWGNFNLAVWFHSFMLVPAVGFRAWHTDVRYRIPTLGEQGELYNPPWGTSDISTHCIGYIQYRAEPKQVEAGWWARFCSAQSSTLQSECLRWKVFNWPPISVRAFDWTALAINW